MADEEKLILSNWAIDEPPVFECVAESLKNA